MADEVVLSPYVHVYNHIQLYNWYGYWIYTGMISLATQGGRGSKGAVAPLDFAFLLCM